jgi:hypothetical protein
MGVVAELDWRLVTDLLAQHGGQVRPAFVTMGGVILSHPRHTLKDQITRPTRHGDLGLPVRERWGDGGGRRPLHGDERRAVPVRPLGGGGREHVPRVRDLSRAGDLQLANEIRTQSASGPRASSSSSSAPRGHAPGRHPGGDRPRPSISRPLDATVVRGRRGDLTRTPPCTGATRSARSGSRSTRWPRACGSRWEIADLGHPSRPRRGAVGDPTQLAGRGGDERAGRDGRVGRAARPPSAPSPRRRRRWPPRRWPRRWRR